VRHAVESGFLIADSRIKADILIPRYYDPRIASSLEQLLPDHELLSIDELVRCKVLRHDHGSYVPKIHYGTGPYPYVRTSDLANGEIKASPKHGVARAVFDEFRIKQDVRPGDILFVHEGTYLIGNAAMVTQFDGPLLYQHHLAKFRVTDPNAFGPFFLMVCLESAPVQFQVRSKQFSADIIDSVVGRLGEVVLPVPKHLQRLREMDAAAKEAIVGRAILREQISYVVSSLDEWLRDGRDDLDGLLRWTPSVEAHRGGTAFLGERRHAISFALSSSEVKGDILLPKYYDPSIQTALVTYQKRCKMTALGELIRERVVAITTGDEIGHINYGSGDIPFVRTSDFGSWELKRYSKQGVSKDVYETWSPRQPVKPGDILLVRDGTYLVGTSIMVSADDLPLLYCGGIFKITCLDPERLDSGLLFALLNLPFVRRQMRNKQFTRDVIDTLGNRVNELILPIPKDLKDCRKIAARMRDLLAMRSAMRRKFGDLVHGLYPPNSCAIA
jgi:hypothetical protein